MIRIFESKTEAEEYLNRQAKTLSREYLEKLWIEHELSRIICKREIKGMC